MKTPVVWLWWVAIAAVAAVFGKVVAAYFEPGYFKYAFLAALLLAWFILDQVTKHQQRRLQEEIGQMSDSQREAFVGEARKRGLVKGGEHET
jgi:Flp pilus assembly protein TadB